MDDSMICYPLEKTSKGWKVVTPALGSGRYGSIWKVCSQETESLVEGGCQHVMKVVKFIPQYTRQRFNKEVAMQKKFAQIGLGVDLEDSWTCDLAGIIIMPRMDITLRDFIDNHQLTKNDLKNLHLAARGMAGKLHEQGYYHGDPHYGNIMLKAESLPSENNLVKTSVGSYSMRFIDPGLAGSLAAPGYRGKKSVTREERMMHDNLIIEQESQRLSERLRTDF